MEPERACHIYNFHSSRKSRGEDNIDDDKPRVADDRASYFTLAYQFLYSYHDLSKHFTDESIIGFGLIFYVDTRVVVGYIDLDPQRFSGPCHALIHIHFSYHPWRKL